MLEVWWVRHGSTDWNKVKRWQGNSNVDLNEEGREQARLLAVKLSPIHFDQVWSSDLSRCYNTARLALPLIKNIHQDPRLREINFGSVEGHTWSELSPELQQKVTDWWKDPYHSYFPGTQESLQNVAERLEAWLKDLPCEGRVIAFSHGGLIRTAVWQVVGPPTDKHQWGMELGNTGIVRIRYNEGFPTLTAFNDVTHLKDYWLAPPAQNVPGSK